MEITFGFYFAGVEKINQNFFGFGIQYNGRSAMDGSKKTKICVVLGILLFAISAVWLFNIYTVDCRITAAESRAKQFCAAKYQLITSRVDEADRMIVFMSPWELSGWQKKFLLDELGYLHIIAESKLVTHQLDAMKVIFSKSHPQWDRLREKIQPGFTIELIMGSPGKADKAKWINYVDILNSVKPKIKKDK